MAEDSIQKNAGVLRSSFPLFSASFVAQGLNFLLLFLLPQLFSVEAISFFFVFSALGGILSHLVSLQSQNAIVLSSSFELALQRLGYTLIIGAVLSAMVLFLSFFETQISSLFLKGRNSTGIILSLSAYCLLGSSLLTTENYFAYQKRFRLIGLMKLMKSSSVFILILLAGILEGGPFYMISAFLGGHLVVVLWILIRRLIPIQKISVNLSGFLSFFREFRSMLFFETTFTLFLQGIVHLPVVLLSLFYGDQVVAFYGIAHKVVATPVGLWNQSIAQVFYKRITEFYNAGVNFFDFAKSNFQKVFSISLVYGVLVGVLAPYFMVWIMGNEWEGAGTVARVIIPLIVFQNAAMPFSAVFTVLRTQRQMLPYFIIGFFVRIILGFVVPFLYFDAHYLTVLLIFSMVGVAYYIVYLYKIFSDIKTYDAGIRP